MRYHMQASKLINGEEYFHSDLFKGYLTSESGKVYSLKSNKFMNPYRNNKKKYLSVYLNGKNVRQHRAVDLTFLHPRECDTEVNHINCVPEDNRLSNLEWCTGEENIAHAIANGRMRKNL